MQENQSVSASSKRLMMLHDYTHNNNNNNNDYHENRHQLPSPSSSSCYGSDGGGGGPLFCNTSNQGVACMSDMYDVVGAASFGFAANTSAALVVSNSPNTCVSNSLLSFDSSASVGEMAASMKVRVAFTAAQLRELERQTMIFKYMMASVPVPDELLLPTTKTNSPSPSQSKKVGFLSDNNSDPEPWRCRRTDGKKWRCSRDVAPDQKYCERHCHKSRPRSRKPVELPAHSRSLNLASCTINKPYSKSHFLNKSMSSSALVFDHQPRCLDWPMKGETIPVAGNSNSNQEWQQMLQSKLESRRDNINGDEHFTEHLCNSNSCINLGGDGSVLQPQRQYEYDQYNLLLSPNLVPRHTQTQDTRHFIDAWSLAEGNIANVDEVGNRRINASSNEKLPHYSVTLSMSSGSEPIERNGNPLMGSLGTMNSETENVGTFRPHLLNHISPPGGPLAEALCLGIASSAKSSSNEASSHKCSTSTTGSDESSYGDGGHGPNFINRRQ